MQRPGVACLVARGHVVDQDAEPHTPPGLGVGLGVSGHRTLELSLEVVLAHGGEVEVDLGGTCRFQQGEGAPGVAPHVGVGHVLERATLGHHLR